MTSKVLAVYGTLKQGYGNHRLILAAGLTYMCDAITADPSYTLQGGGFPIARTHGVDKVQAELYSFENFEQIASIDRLEGHPNWYQRREIPFEFRGEIIWAWMYLQPALQSYGHAQSEGPGITVNEKGVAKWSR